MIQNNLVVLFGSLMIDKLKEELDQADFATYVLNEKFYITNNFQHSTIIYASKFKDQNGNAQEIFLHFTDVNND